MFPNFSKERQTQLDFALEGLKDIQLINGVPWDGSLSILLAEDSIIRVNTIGRPKFKNGKCKRITGTVQIVENDNAGISEIDKEGSLLLNKRL